MSNSNKQHKIILWIELGAIVAVILAPLLTLGMFLIKHQALVLSSQAWLLMAFAYQCLILLVGPCIYSLALELLFGKNSANENPPRKQAFAVGTSGSQELE